VQAFARRSVRAKGTEAEKAADVLRAAQSLGYHPDPPGEWFQFPMFTLSYGGDCEDLVGFLISIAMIVGIPAEPKWLDQPGSPLNHITSRLFVDGKWLWADPTVVGARLGEHPYAAFNRTSSWHRIAAASELGLYQNAA
jgi:transglutaminase-like putative cysteine protease